MLGHCPDQSNIVLWSNIERMGKVHVISMFNVMNGYMFIYVENFIYIYIYGTI